MTEPDSDDAPYDDAEGPYLNARERYLRFIIYSLDPEHKEIPFRVMTREALSNNQCEVDIHDFFLTMRNRSKIQCMTKSDLSGLETYYVFAQCERYMSPSNAQADADQMNRLYAASLCE